MNRGSPRGTVSNHPVTSIVGGAPVWGQRATRPSTGLFYHPLVVDGVRRDDRIFGNGSRQSCVWVLDQFTRWQSVNWDYSGRLQKAQMDTAELAPDTTFRLPG